MMGATQLARLRGRVAAAIEKTFPTSIIIESHTIPAARYKASHAVKNELSGIMPSYDVSWRIRREALPAGIVIRPGRTTVAEGDKTYGVEKVTDTVGDPCIVVDAIEA